jgi:hypothetical protein
VAVRTQRYALLYLRVSLLVTTNASQTTNLSLLGARIRMMEIYSPRMRKATLSALQRSLVLVPRISVALARILGVGLVTLLVLLVPSDKPAPRRGAGPEKGGSGVADRAI